MLSTRRRSTRVSPRHASRFASRSVARPGARSFALLVALLILAPSFSPPAPRRAHAQSARLSADDDAFLEDLSRRAFLYFWEQADPRTGLVLDRAHADGTNYPPGDNHHNVASSAATGFGLTALCIAAERRWIEPREARARVRATLRFYAERAEQFRGWFYHWTDAATGARRWNSEVSTIDTALLLAGVLAARGAFRDDAEIVRLATRIYDRVDFPWMLDARTLRLSHGWRPETGFLKTTWDTYSEHLVLDLLAVGSRTHHVTPRAWRAWRRERITYAGYTYLTGGPLFVHQYSHAWVDFRGRREGWYPFTDYFANSVAATRAHKQFCLALSTEFPGYTENVWGITASDGALGYVAWGGPPRDPAIDGTVVPCAAGGSLMFTPDISLPALREMRARFGERVYGRYGFTDAFNPTTGWVDADVIGINVGITLLSAENLRTGNVWRWFMRNAEIARAMDAVGLVGGKRAGRLLPSGREGFGGVRTQP
ncbi:MAG TPA: glucoamylase family protein [Pyrinomonadaceae bacterium]|jgi:hypothetical protein|nr:glucoamylase family protein [Pyrinomonadaceae bacterium]